MAGPSAFAEATADHRSLGGGGQVRPLSDNFTGTGFVSSFMRASARTFFEQYTRDLTPADFQRLFTRDTPEAYRYFTRAIDVEKLAHEPWYRRWPIEARLVFTAFTMRLSPARRVLYALAVVMALFGVLMLFRGVAPVDVLLFPFRI